jgi:FkbM family methyltransferase
MSGRVERVRDALIGTWLEPPARFFWKRVLHRRSQNDLYDELTAAIMRRTLGPASNAVDVGCHGGLILDEVLRLAPDGSHLAFEPLPDLAAALRRKYADHPNVTVHELALSRTAGVATFHANRSRPALSGLQRRDDITARERVEQLQVRTERLDVLVGADRRIDFVKVDVEGAESLVFEGARECLTRDRPVVVFEHGEPSRRSYGADAARVHDLLIGCGLAVSLLDGFLRGAAPLTRDQLGEQVDRGLNFYFVAHPPEGDRARR